MTKKKPNVVVINVRRRRHTFLVVDTLPYRPFWRTTRRNRCGATHDERRRRLLRSPVVSSTGRRTCALISVRAPTGGVDRTHAVHIHTHTHTPDNARTLGTMARPTGVRTTHAPACVRAREAGRRRALARPHRSSYPYRHHRRPFAVNGRHGRRTRPGIFIVTRLGARVRRPRHWLPSPNTHTTETFRDTNADFRSFGPDARLTTRIFGRSTRRRSTAVLYTARTTPTAGGAKRKQKNR